MLMAVILLLATGYLSYRNLSFIVSSIQVDEKPEQRLITIREISMEIEKAESSIRIYRTTRNTADLRPYYTVISGIDEKMNRLRAECRHDSIMLEQTETIAQLIEKNILNWNELLYLINDNSVLEYLKQLSDELNAVSADSVQKEKGILRRVFSRNNKIQVDEQKIISKIKEIEKQDLIAKEKLMAQESKIAGVSMEIKEQLYDLITKMENEVTKLIGEKAQKANLVAEKTYRGLIMFTVSGMLLALLVMLIIIQYVRKTYAYQHALEKSKVETENLARTKELFMASMSHEIRTPLTAISGFTEQLLHESSDSHMTRYLKIIKSSSDHLVKIINDILDFSKLQNGKLELEKLHFQVRQVLEEVYVMFENEAVRNHNSLSFSIGPETPPVIIGDPHRLKQIIINLLSNSVKFTSDGKIHFNVDVFKTETGEAGLLIEVTDTGIGIEESKLQFIFEDFSQEEMSTTRKYGGTGLGLSIVKKLVELHSGSIECNSRKNQGTKISIRLPCIPGDEAQIKEEPGPETHVPEKIRKLNILIVDDEVYNRLLFKAILDRWGVKYHEAGNASEALELIKRNQYDLLFMDLRMPGMDGFTATKIIRGELKIKQNDMPIICISAAAVLEDWEKYENAGMNAFLQKPFTEEALLQTILHVIQYLKPGRVSAALSKHQPKATAKGKINLANLLHIAGTDQAFKEQMILTFVDTTGKGLQDMHHAIDAGRLDTVEYLAHKILPPCRHIGAKDLSALLEKIEKGIRNHTDNEIIKTLILEAIQEYEIVSELLKQEL